MAEKSKHGTFCWNELMTHDMGGARKFYTELLGWGASDMPMAGGQYTVFKAAEAQAGGMMKIDPKWGEVPSHWMAYITVDDVDASTKKAEKLGGKVIVQPTDIPTVGRFSVISDPTGATVGLITPPKK